jgi:hypothetical protein
MIDKATDILKWIVTLTPQKSVIAILLILVGYFGWNNFNTTITNEVLQTERNNSAIDCATKIAVSNLDCQTKLMEQTTASQARYDEYRDKVEVNNLETIRVWEAKYETIQGKLDNAQIKQSQNEELMRQITKKLK